MAVRDGASLLVGLLVLCHTWGAWADVEVSMEDRVEVFRGETAQITCMFVSAEGIGGMTIHWLYVTRFGEKQNIYYQDSSMKLVERGTPFTHRISVNGTGATGQVVLSISNVQLEDELEFICLIKSLTDGTGEGRTRLKVFAKPDLPVIEGVQTGISVNENDLSKIATCEVTNGYPRPNVTWYRNNTPLRMTQGVVDIVHTMTTKSSGLLSVKSELSIKVVKEDKDDTFYCAVTFFVPGATKMTESNRINITVYYPSTAVSVWVESPKGKIKEGDSVELHCRGNGNSPSSFTVKHAKTGLTFDSNVVMLHNVTRQNSGLYQCGVLDMDTFEEISGETTVVVNFLDPVVVKPNDTVVVGQGDKLMTTCDARSSLPTHAVWFKDGKEVSKGHSLILKDATYDTAGTYVCVVTAPEIEGMETSGSLLVYVQGPPEITEEKQRDMEESFGNMVDLSCRVRGFPSPSVTWTTSDGKVLKTVSEEETAEGIHSVVRVKVTSDITAFCSASNAHGTKAVTFNIKAIKPETAIPPKKIKKESSGVIIAVIIICILLLAILGSVLYFLYKKGKICGRSGKQDLTKEKSNKDNIVVEMKSDNTEEAVLLGVNGEKQPPNDQ